MLDMSDRWRGGGGGGSTPCVAEPFCAGIDWLWESDYMAMRSGERGAADAAAAREMSAVPVEALRLAPADASLPTADGRAAVASGAEQPLG